jgi:acetyltransferase-like isoleucine patch superfamily enzyme
MFPDATPSEPLGRLRKLARSRGRLAELVAGATSVREQADKRGGWRYYLFYPPGPGPRLMSRLRKRWVIWRNPAAHIQFGDGVYLGPGFHLHMPHGGTFIVGNHVEFRRGFRGELGGPTSRITIGDGCYFTYDAILSADTTIEIGQRCGIGQNCYIVDGSHRYHDLDQTFLEQGYNYRSIHIDDDAQIHSKVTVVNSIGKRAIIGANAVITKPVPPYCVAGGVPAKVLEYYGPPGGEPPGWVPRSESSASTSG